MDRAGCTATRRRVLGAAGAGLLTSGPLTAALGGCAQAPAAPPVAAGPRPAPQRLADGVWLLAGAPGDIEPANEARTGNVLLVAGPGGAIVLDSGGSRRDGEALLAQVRALTDRPLRALLLSHAMQEFVFGASAFQDAGVPVWMHADAARLMAARCETCLKTLQRELGAEAMAGTRLVRPDRLFDAGTHALPDIGRPLQLLAAADGRRDGSPGASGLFEPAGGVLAAPGQLEVHTIPDLQDADRADWLAGLRRLQALGARQVVGGHGPAGAADTIAAIADYIDGLEQRIATLLRAGTALSEVADAATLPAYAGWARYDSTHRRNAALVFLRQERALLLGQQPPARRGARA